MAYNFGGIVRLTYAVKNDLEQAANPSTATCVITQPDGTTTSPTVTLPPVSTGLLIVDFTPTQAGLHSVDWTTSAPTTSEDDVFTVERPASQLVSVDEAVNHLGAAGIITSDADRETLQWLCLVATEAIEADLGRAIVRRTVVETHDGGQHAIMLRQTPVISVTSVVGRRHHADPGHLLVRLDIGVPVLRHGGYSGRFAYGRMQNVVVTYVAGYANPPRVVRLAALNLIQSCTRDSSRPPSLAGRVVCRSVRGSALPATVADPRLQLAQSTCRRLTRRAAPGETRAGVAAEPTPPGLFLKRGGSDQKLGPALFAGHCGSTEAPAVCLRRRETVHRRGRH